MTGRATDPVAVTARVYDAKAGHQVSAETEDPDQLGGPQAWLVRVARRA